MEELASAFALDALLNEEREVYREHLAQCGICEQLVGQFQIAADLLPESLEEAPASLALKERVLAQARVELETRANQAPARLVEPRRTQWSWGWPSWMTLSPARALAVLALLVVGLVAWNVNLQLGLNDRNDLTLEQSQLIETIASGARVSPLAGTEAAPAAGASLVQAPENSRAFLLVRNLPRLPADKEYQVWSIKGEVPVSAGTFVSADGGNQLITLSADFSDADAIGVSIEPLGGSVAPTGAIVLLGAL